MDIFTIIYISGFIIAWPTATIVTAYNSFNKEPIDTGGLGLVVGIFWPVVIATSLIIGLFYVCGTLAEKLVDKKL